MERKGDWIQTYTGKHFYPLDPRVEDIDIRDIAHALALQCRYNGHTRDFYSVAEHSVLVSENVHELAKLPALLHDAAEAYLSDIPRPIKPMIPEYKRLEGNIMFHILQKFTGCPAVDGELWEEIKRVDDGILGDEAKALMGDPQDWTFYAPPIGIRIYCWEPVVAEENFIKHFERLTNKKDTLIERYEREGI